MVYWKEGEELNSGKYLVEQLLGSGGFGVTYRIRETRTNKLFALKTLNEIAKNKPDFPQLQSKFINEAIALANCRHPNIVEVYPQGFQEGELWCMVMEYIEGKDLAKHLDQGDKFGEKKAVEIIIKVGEALNFVHQQGLLHRDIKPANILLRNSGSTPVLIDFGLAREYNTNPDSIKSMTNSMTECFAPIEQYQRQGKFGAWTDVYALAATLYVLVTKQMPFPARFREHAELVPPQKHNPKLSDRLNEAILKGLELQPEDRPQTVKAWLEMLKPPQPIPQPQPQQGVAQENNGSNRGSQTVTRRNWLKYSGLAIASMVIALLGKEMIDNSSQTSDSSESIQSSDEPKDSQIQLEITENKPETQSNENGLKLAEYEFDVITVNDRGEEIKREKGSAKYFTEDLGNNITLEMVEIPGGTFMMGSPEAELARNDNESPQHKVTVPSFYMGKYEVTQAQWKAVAALPKVGRELKPEPSYFKGEELPVESISWYDAVEFCKRLSKATGKEYRLPSEAEWEYACRAGTTTPFHFGETITTNLVNYRGTDWEYEGTVYPGNYANGPKGEYKAKMTPVGSFPSNAFGLYDLHGNVWEWCGDRYQESYTGAPRDGSPWETENSSSYVLRGGSWDYYPQCCRSATRNRVAPDGGYLNVGFRCIATRTL
jgi:formylglycine-generating enzyme required for sulfatase activity/tRNA A-37 threonylcarbamoyl transferase component Bud32